MNVWKAAGIYKIIPLYAENEIIADNAGYNVGNNDHIPKQNPKRKSDGGVYTFPKPYQFYIAPNSPFLWCPKCPDTFLILQYAALLSIHI